MPRITQLPSVRFARHVNKDGPTQPHMETPCWMWTAARHERGYGAFGLRTRVGRTSIAAHRFSWTLAHGPIPEGALVLHQCDNPPCVRPDHLHLGTNQENMDEAVERKRFVQGDDHWMRRCPERVPRGDDNPARRYPERIRKGSEVNFAKLTEGKVAEILAAVHREGWSVIAARFGVCRRTVELIAAGRTWKHVPRPDTVAACS